MWYPDDILNLYSKVISDDIVHNGVKISGVRFGVWKMAHAYKPCPNSLQSNERRTVDFNVKAHRCAYLHKNGAFHTALVYRMMARAITQSPHVYQRLTRYRKVLKICSLGGGPGTDLIGVLSALHHQFGFFHCSATIVDLMSGWEDAFHSILLQLRSGDYGSLGQSMQSEYFDWSFVTADLLGETDRNAREAIHCADIITMIKFVSAAACLDTASMIGEIFRSMKPNALVFFIDNASGGFRELVIDAARKYKLNTVFGPLFYEKFEDESFKINKFGYDSCYKTTVTVQILTKPHFAGISEAHAATVHHPSSAMSYENSSGSINVGRNDKLFVTNGHMGHLTNVNPIQSKKNSLSRARKVKIPKHSEGTRKPLSSQKQAVARIKQISSYSFVNPDSESKSNGIENKNTMICSQTYINSNILKKETPRNPLEHAVLQNRTKDCIKNINKELHNRPSNQPPGMLAGNHQVVPQHTSVEKKRDREPNSVGNTFSETTKGAYRGAGLTNTTPNSKSLQCSGEKPHKILEQLISNESSSQKWKPPKSSADLDATKRNSILKPPTETRSLQFNEGNGNAQNIDKCKFPNAKEKENYRPIRVSYVHNPSLSTQRVDNAEALLNALRSNCINTPHRTIPPQSAPHNATRFIQRNSPTNVISKSIPPPDVKSSEDGNCSCCVIS